MKYIELPLLNHLYIIHPRNVGSDKLPLGLCPREETVGPDKIFSLLSVVLDEHAWHLDDDGWEWCCVRWRGGFYYGDIESMYFYVMGRHGCKEMIQKMRFILGSDDFDRWFQMYAKTYLMVTSPVFKTKEGRRIFYSTKYIGRAIFAPDAMDIADASEIEMNSRQSADGGEGGAEDEAGGAEGGAGGAERGETGNYEGSRTELDYIIDFKGFSVASGLILALALNRRNYWSHWTIMPGLRNLIERTRAEYAEGEDISSYLIPEWNGHWNDFYVENIIQICDVPGFYALCGNGVEWQIREVILSIFNQPECYIQHFYNNVIYYITPKSLAFPNLPLSQWHDGVMTRPEVDADNEVELLSIETEPDISGFLLNLVRNRGVWKYWMSSNFYQKRVLLDEALSIADTEDKGIEAVVKFIFHYYNNPHQNGLGQFIRRNRLRHLWKFLIQLKEDKLYSWFFRKYCLKLIVNMNAYMPVPHMSLLKDYVWAMRHKKGFLDCHQDTFVFADRVSEAILKDTFGERRVRSSDSSNRYGAITVITLQLTLSYFEVWKALAKQHWDFHVCINRWMLPRIKAKMMVLKKATMGGCGSGSGGGESGCGAQDAVMEYMNRAENRWMWI